VPAEALYELVRLTFQMPSGHARSAVFGRLLKTAGAATHQAILRLQSDPGFPISPQRLRQYAKDRAIQDSESAPWVPSEALAFERHHETAPRTAKDLRAVLVSRLEDMAYDLLHGDFAQGLTLRSLAKEVDVQNWIADRLRLRQGRAFSVEREPHVIDEKKPDIRIRAKATDASVAMEIKVAEAWTLRQLNHALEVQLCGQYLRANDGRYGVLLLVHQRQKKWANTTTENYLTFAEVVAHLSERAAQIAGAHHDSPQPEICMLDVSSEQMRT
jgi:hypothetical protein